MYRIFYINVLDISILYVDYGLGYAWDPQVLTIQVGDIVRWTWVSPPFITTGARYAVWQTDGLGGTAYYPQGFSSPVPGSFDGMYRSPTSGNICVFALVTVAIF